MPDARAEPDQSVHATGRLPLDRPGQMIFCTQSAPLHLLEGIMRNRWVQGLTRGVAIAAAFALALLFAVLGQLVLRAFPWLTPPPWSPDVPVLSLLAAYVIGGLCAGVVWALLSSRITRAHQSAVAGPLPAIRLSWPFDSQ